MILKETLHKLKSGKDVKIVALGDSLTYGWMVGKGYLDYLMEFLSTTYPGSRIEIVNRGIPGDTADDGRYRVERQVVSSRPDLVFIQFGLNDAFSGYTPDQFRKNILAIITAIGTGTSAEMLLVTSGALQDSDDRIVGKYYDILKEISEEKNIPIALVHEYWQQKMSQGVKFETLIKDDGVHPTEEGYRLMAETIFQALT